MSSKKIIILGTAAQVPTKIRNHSGYFLQWHQHGFLIDPGEGTQRQMTMFGVKASSITKIFLTHFHGDHCLGLPGVIQRIILDGATREIEIYFPETGREILNHLLSVSFHDDRLKISLRPIAFDGPVYTDKFLTITAGKLAHTIDSFGLRFKENDDVSLIPEKLIEVGLRGRKIRELKESGSVMINDKLISVADVSNPKIGKCAAFVTDTSYCDNAIQLAKDADLFVCEATYSSEHIDLADKYGHLTSEQSARIAQEAGVQFMVLTHFSQRYSSTQPLLNEAKRIFPATVAAKDGDVFDLLAENI